MINGILYGVFYFSLVPLLVVIMAGFDLSFYPENFFLTKQYDLDFPNLYVAFLIVFLFIFLIFIFKRDKKIDVGLLYVIVKKIRTDSKFILCVHQIFFVSTLLDFIYIDHSMHWLERAHLKIIPDSLRFYLNPFFSFVIFVSMINIVASLVVFLRNKKSKVLFSIWLYFDIFLLFMVIYNSGNRWYLALLAALFFYFSSAPARRNILFLSPFFIMAGGIFSILVVAWRTGGSMQDLLTVMFDKNNLQASFMVAVIAVTEGLNLASLFELANVSLFSPDPVYPILKIIQMPLPGFALDKLPPFNIHVTYLFTGYYSEWSLNTSLLGVFVYGFGVFALPMMVLFLVFVRYYEKIPRINGVEFFSVVWFCLYFSGYRFGFEYLFVHTLYFSLIFYLISRKVMVLYRLNK